MKTLKHNAGLETQVGERIFNIKRSLYRISLPTPYKIGDANVYFLDGDAPVLFDSGAGDDGGMAVLADSLKLTGRRIADIRHVMLTHAHLDHCGGAGRIREESGCEVYVHEREVNRVRDFISVSRAEIDPMMPIMFQMGFDKTIGRHAMEVVEKFAEATESCPQAEPLPDRLETSAGDITWDYVPGHSPGDVMFRIEGTPHILTGDHVLPFITTSPGLDISDGLEYSKSVDRFQTNLSRTSTMNGVVGCPGHGPVFPDVGKRAEALLKTQEGRKRRTADLIDLLAPCSALEIAVGLFGLEYKFEMLMFANEVTGYATQLAREGVCSLQREPGKPEKIMSKKDAEEAG